MHLDGWTLFLQLINFLVLVAILRWALYRPLRKLAEARQARLQEAEAAAARAQAAADAARVAHEAALADLLQQSRSRLDEAERQAAQLRLDAQARGQREAAELIATARRTLAQERATALDWLVAESGRIGTRFAASILAEHPQEATEPLTLSQAARALAALPEADYGRLAAARAQLTLTTAAPLDEAQRARWQATLLPWIGAEAAPTFRVDPTLLGGALLEWPGARLDLSWAQALRRAQADWSAAEAADVVADR